MNTTKQTENTMKKVGDRIRVLRNGRMVNVKATDLQTNRIRFNWGYHDGASDQFNGRGHRMEERLGAEWTEKHHDPVYVDGYLNGKVDARTGRYFDDSSSAWINSDYADHGDDAVAEFRFKK